MTRRFPALRIGIMAGGVAWACALFADIIEHWKKRNRDRIADYDPVHLDQAKLKALFQEYGARPFEGTTSETCPSLDKLAGWITQDPELMDEWAACRIERAEDIRDLFIPNFYFGCEGDDKKVNPLGSKLKAFLGSDIGHWDVPDMTEVLSEAYELVERGDADDASIIA